MTNATHGDDTTLRYQAAFCARAAATHALAFKQVLAGVNHIMPHIIYRSCCSSPFAAWAAADAAGEADRAQHLAAVCILRLSEWGIRVDRLQQLGGDQRRRLFGFFASIDQAIIQCLHAALVGAQRGEVHVIALEQGTLRAIALPRSRAAGVARLVAQAAACPDAIDAAALFAGAACAVFQAQGQCTASVLVCRRHLIQCIASGRFEGTTWSRPQAAAHAQLGVCDGASKIITAWWTEMTKAMANTKPRQRPTPTHRLRWALASLLAPRRWAIGACPTAAHHHVQALEGRAHEHISGVHELRVRLEAASDALHHSADGLRARILVALGSDCFSGAARDHGAIRQHGHAVLDELRKQLDTGPHQGLVAAAACLAGLTRHPVRVSGALSDMARCDGTTTAECAQALMKPPTGAPVAAVQARGLNEGVALSSGVSLAVQFLNHRFGGQDGLVGDALQMHTDPWLAHVCRHVRYVCPTDPIRPSVSSVRPLT